MPGQQKWWAGRSRGHNETGLCRHQRERQSFRTIFGSGASTTLKWARGPSSMTFVIFPRECRWNDIAISRRVVALPAARRQYVLLFAADEAGPVLAIEDMLKLMEQGCEFVSCSRYAHGGRQLGGSLIGGILSRLANCLFRLATGTRFTDCTTGIKMFRRSVFERLDLQARPVGWAVAFEMAMKAQYIGLQLGEVPIISIDRLYGGKSTFRLGAWCVEYSRWFFWGVRHLHRWRTASPHVKVALPSVLCR